MPTHEPQPTAGPPQSDAAEVRLRPVEDGDLPLFFAYEQEPEAIHRAAFTPPDPTDAAAFAAHWARIRSDPAVVNRTILVDGAIAGHLARYVGDHGPEVTYWLGRAFWGRGIATRALALLLAEETQRPIFARTAQDNHASLRVLQHCGFVIIGADRGFAHGRGGEVDEWLLRLD